MSLSLQVDGKKWRSHLHSMLERHPGLVPVIKGNGYGFGLELLAAEASRLGVETVAVGLDSEIARVRSAFSGEIILLSPDLIENEISDGSVIQTISSLASLHEVDPRRPIILELLTPLHRHGISMSEFDHAIAMIEKRGLLSRGFALHLPIAKVDTTWLDGVLSKLPQGSTVWISHLPNPDRVRNKFPNLHFRERIGTDLWLGDQTALEVRATVLENRNIQGAAGYRQRKVRGHVIVVSGGTAHGIGLVAPSGDRTLIGRLKLVGKAIELSLGRMRSPYIWNGRILDFLEPPHMQCSLLLSRGSDQPATGEELKVRVRFTTTTFDQIIVR